MVTIWKYPLWIVDKQTIEMPLNAKILTVQLQGDRLQLWAMALTHQVTEPRTIQIVGTGHPLPGQVADWNYIATVQTNNGQLVWHIFEE